MAVNPDIAMKNKEKVSVSITYKAIAGFKTLY